MNIENIEELVKNGQDFSRGDFHDEDLSCLNLRNGLFRKADFSRTDLSDSNLSGADLREALLKSANLSNADLRDANLSGADLTNAFLGECSIERANFNGCIGVSDAGTDLRGYRFIGVKQDDGAWMIKAGCRWFTVEQAEDHWEMRENDDALARVAEIVRLASLVDHPKG